MQGVGLFIMSYSEKLKDPRWKEFRQQILVANNFKCQICEEDKNLQVHHGYYETGLDPWNYNPDTVWCLCKNCHENVWYDMRNIHKMLAMINPSHLKLASEYILKFHNNFRNG